MDDTPKYLNDGEEGCAKCSYKERINNINKLKKGDHICIDGQNVGCYCFCIRKSLYKHHAIVEKVELIQRSSSQNVESTQQQAPNYAAVHVIEYGLSTDQMKVRKHDYCIDLRSELSRVWVVSYRSKTFTPDKIYLRAERKLNESDYSLPTNNCEHFCNDSCVGQKESLQVNTMCACLKRSACLGSDLMKLVRFVAFVVIWSSDDLLQAFTKEPYSLLMLVVFLSVYFFYTVLTCCGYSVCVCKPAWKCCCEQIKCADCFNFVWKATCVEFIVYCFCQVGSFFCLLELVKMNFKCIIEVAFGIGCSLINLIILILIRRLMKHWLLPVKSKQKAVSGEQTQSASWEKGSDVMVDIEPRKDAIEDEPDTVLENVHTDDDRETENGNVVTKGLLESTSQERITTKQEDPEIHTHISETEYTNHEDIEDTSEYPEALNPLLPAVPTTLNFDGNRGELDSGGLGSTDSVNNSATCKY